MALKLEGWVEGQDAAQDAAAHWYRVLPREKQDAIAKEFWDDSNPKFNSIVWLTAKYRALQEKRAEDMAEKEKDALAAWVMGRSLSERNAFYGELERRWKATGRSREGLYYEIAREWKARAEALEHPRPAPQEEEEKQEWEHIKLLPGRRKVYFRFRDGLSAVGIGGVVGADMAVKLANWLGEDEEEEEQQAEEDTPHPFGDEKAEGEASGEETPEESEESEEEPEQEGEDGELTEEVYEREFGMPEDGEDEEEDDDFEEGGGEDGEEGDDFEEEDEDGGEASEEERIPSEGEGGGDIDVEDFLLALRDGQRAEDDPSGGDGHGTGILIREED